MPSFQTPPGSRTLCGWALVPSGTSRESDGVGPSRKATCGKQRTGLWARPGPFRPPLTRGGGGGRERGDSVTPRAVTVAYVHPASLASPGKGYT